MNRRADIITANMTEKNVTTRETQYQRSLDLQNEGVVTLGLMTNQAWRDDPKHLLFTLARYKFAAKMLSSSKHVLEVGCADAFGTRIVVQETDALTAVDFDPVFVQDALERMEPDWQFECKCHDMLAGPVDGAFDGAYALDVIEHISPENETLFVENIVRSLAAHGILIIGTPSLQSQAYASPQSKAGHVNCKDAPALKALMGSFFHNVFIFSMNDEVVHTGYYPMAHYLFGVACTKRS